MIDSTLVEFRVFRVTDSRIEQVVTKVLDRQDYEGAYDPNRLYTNYVVRDGKLYHIEAIWMGRSITVRQYDLMSEETTLVEGLFSTLTEPPSSFHVMAGGAVYNCSLGEEENTVMIQSMYDDECKVIDVREHSQIFRAKHIVKLSDTLYMVGQKPFALLPTHVQFYTELEEHRNFLTTIPLYHNDKEVVFAFLFVGLEDTWISIYSITGRTVGETVKPCRRCTYNE